MTVPSSAVGRSPLFTIPENRDTRDVRPQRSHAIEIRDTADLARPKETNPIPDESGHPENSRCQKVTDTLIACTRGGIGVPKPDAVWGERPVAFVLTDADLDHEALTRGLQGRIAAFKIPKEFRPLDPTLLEQPKRMRAALKSLVMSD